MASPLFDGMHSANAISEQAEQAVNLFPKHIRRRKAYCIYVHLGMMVFTFLSDMWLISETVRGAWFAENTILRIRCTVLAMLMTMCVFYTLCLQHAVLPFIWLPFAARETVKTGMRSEPLLLFFQSKAVTRDTYMSLFIAYSALTQPHWQRARLNDINKIVNHLLSVYSLGNIVTQTHAGDLESEYAIHVIKKGDDGMLKLFILQLWCTCTVGSQLVLTSVIASIGPAAWRILMTMFVMIPMFLAHVAELSPGKGKCGWCGLVCMCFSEPLFLFAPCFSSVFGLRQYDGNRNQGNQPGYYHGSMLVLRLGFIFFWAAIVIDTTEINRYCEWHRGCSYREFTSLTYMVVFIVFALPLSLFGFMFLLCNECFLYGSSNDELNRKVREFKADANKRDSEKETDICENDEDDYSGCQLCDFDQHEGSADERQAPRY